MPYDPTKRGYAYVDGELPVRQRQSGATRTAQVLPRKEYNPAELARQARHQAREEARQRNRPAAHTTAGIPEEDYEEYDPADIDGNGDVWPPRMPTSTRRYATNLPQGNAQYQFHPDQVQHIPRRKSATAQAATQGQRVVYTNDIAEQEIETERPRPKPRKGHTRVRFHPLVWLGLGMIVMFFLWVGISYVSAWGKTTIDDWQYSRPRTYQTDRAVGHSDSATNPTHFIAVNLNRHIIVIELPGGDSSKARIYNITTLFGNGQELTPVTLSFKDVNNDGLLDMEVHIQEQTIVFINENGQFRPLKPTEHVHL